MQDPQRTLEPTLKKSVVAAWASFDFANSSFAMIMVTFVYPLYFGNVIVTDGHGDLYWGISVSVSMLVVALLAPALGAIADKTQSKKAFLGLFTSFAVLGTAGAAFIEPGMIIGGALLFIVANAGFEGGIVFYDAFLPEIAPKEKYGRISGIGFATGYVGSLVIILLTKDLLLSNNLSSAFLITAGVFAVFAIPLFLFVPEQKHQRSALSLLIVRDSFRQILTTMKNIRRFPSLAWFLLAFFLYNDAILTVIGFSGRYAQNTLKFETGDLIILLMMVQAIAIFGSLIFGYVADKIGPKRTIMLTLYIWMGVIIGAYLSTDATSFYVVAAMTGIALGSSQATSRSLMAKLTPPEHSAEFFGFYDGFCGKASAVIGPLLFGFLSTSFGQRPAIVSLGVLFILGLTLMRKVNDVQATPRYEPS
jgi:MFS transporter, UMF1 family